MADQISTSISAHAGNNLAPLGLIAVRSRLKGWKIRYVPMTPGLAAKLRKYPAVIGEEYLFPPKRGSKGEPQRVKAASKPFLP
jgi:hypothetical protein